LESAFAWRHTYRIAGLFWPAWLALKAMPYGLLADAILLLHLALVVFVVGELAAILAGNRRGWHWVNAPWFRWGHLAAIATVVVQAWLGQVCPLTTLESWLRLRAGSPAYRSGFIEHWVQGMLFHEAPWWAFASAYTAFGALVLLAWWRFPPLGGRPERKGA
jgi:hypothetical protein